MRLFAIKCVMHILALWPLPLLRGTGVVLGHLLFLAAKGRRAVVLINLQLAFPDLSPAAQRQLAKKHFVRFAQALLDRAWLWHAPKALVRARLTLRGDVAALHSGAGLTLFAPHFVGLDAGGLAVALQSNTPVAFIFAPQRGADLDDWVQSGRSRFGNTRAFVRGESIKPMLAALRDGEKLHLSPDMDLGRQDSLFVPFFGVDAATVPSLSRLARLGKTPVRGFVTRMTARGYECRILPLWEAFPSDDAHADTLRMNTELEAWVRDMPEQYYWVHKRYKTRPVGQVQVYPGGI
jgi:Kdo2-lipid IVA lauroyltransferase/acyltransferase